MMKAQHAQGLSWLILALLASAAMWAGDSAFGQGKNPAPKEAAAVPLFSNGAIRHGIVLCDDAIEAERMAAEELVHYLKETTGATFPVISESKADAGQPGIYLGWTRFARRHGVEPETLGVDEFVIQSEGESLVLCGSRPRGTLYAVGEFLERFCDVRWLTFYGEDYVKPRKELVIPAVSIRQKPAFVVRDLMLGGYPGGFHRSALLSDKEDRAHVFLRLNGHSRTLHGLSLPSDKWRIQERWKGPHLAHTLQAYLPPAKFFESNPEYFGLVDGKRVKDAQICLTSEEVRQVFLQRLLDRIAAEGDGIYSISAQEHLKQCRCESCRALMEREGTFAAPLIDFVNYLADGIRDQHSNVLLETLAYQFTFVPPKTMRVADNVIVRLGHLNRHFFEPMVSPYNKAGKTCWREWREITKHLALWGYPGFHIQIPLFPHPNMAQVYSEDLKFYKRLGVERIFYQSMPATTSQHCLEDLRCWLLAKLMWNPEQDPYALIEDFCDHYYGPAGPFINRYVKLEDDTYAQSEGNSPFRSDGQDVYYHQQPEPGSDPVQWFRNAYHQKCCPTCLHTWMQSLAFDTYRFLDLDFFVAGQELFQQAENRVKDDPVLWPRVRRARLSLDHCSLRLFNRLAEEYGHSTGSLEGFPLDREEIGQRYLDTMSRDRYGKPVKQHQPTIKFIQSAKKADKHKKSRKADSKVEPK